MNHNNQIRAARLHAQTSTFAASLRSKFRGDNLSEKIPPRLGDYQNRIRALVAELPIEHRSAFSRLLERDRCSIELSHQEGLKLDRVIREWTEIVESEQAFTAQKIARFTEMIRPVVGEMRARLIAEAQDKANELHRDYSHSIYEDEHKLRDFGNDHLEFEEHAEQAKQALTRTGPVQALDFSEQQEPFEIDFNLLLKPTRDALDAKLGAYTAELRDRSEELTETLFRLRALLPPEVETSDGG